MFSKSSALKKSITVRTRKLELLYGGCCGGCRSGLYDFLFNFIFVLLCFYCLYLLFFVRR